MSPTLRNEHLDSNKVLPKPALSVGGAVRAKAVRDVLSGDQECDNERETWRWAQDGEGRTVRETSRGRRARGATKKGEPVGGTRTEQPVRRKQ